jgi:hypothetical protein
MRNSRSATESGAHIKSMAINTPNEVSADRGRQLSHYKLSV